MATVTGTNGNDTLEGTVIADTILGLGGNDTIRGKAGDDLLDGGLGDDTIEGGAGNDDMVGGAGNDVIETGSPASVGFDDIDAGPGDDTLDVIVFPSTLVGFDSLAGGTGVDTVNLLLGEVVGNSRFDLQTGTADFGVRTAPMTGIENLSLDVAGAVGEVEIVGTGAANRLRVRGAGLGDAEVSGLAGDDELFGEARGGSFSGGEGNDLIDRSTALEGAALLDGGSGDDLLKPGPGADQVVGGSGVDTVSYDSFLADPGSLDVDLALAGAAGNASTHLLAVGDTLDGIEAVIGDSGNDRLAGNDAVNTLKGLEGDDVLIGRGGGDLLEGGPGFDTVSYRGSRVAVTVDLQGGSTGGDAQGDQLVAIENIEGGGGADTLKGDGAANRLDGGQGNDRLEGRAGDDRYVRGPGFDTILDTEGTDDRILGSLTDLSAAQRQGDDLRLAFATGDQILILGHFAGQAVETFRLVAGGNSSGSIVMGTGSTGGNQSGILAGTEGDDELDGRGGNDFLFGSDGDDLLIGGRGNDLLQGDAGDDRLEGGAGRDLFRFSPGDGDDRIEDFGRTDRLDLVAFGFATAEEVLALLEDGTEGAVLRLAEDQSVTLAGLGADQLRIEQIVVA